jgi:hypothetical protein
MKSARNAATTIFLNIGHPAVLAFSKSPSVPQAGRVTIPGLIVVYESKITKMLDTCDRMGGVLL